MNQKSMTALVSLFARARHAQKPGVKIFSDTVAQKLISAEEYRTIFKSMTDGISFFAPDFSGSAEEAMDFINDRFLSPSPLGRSAFAESALENAVMLGARQYLIFAAGYDSYACRRQNKNLRVFEIDHPKTAADKQRRLSAEGIEIPENTFYISADFNTDSVAELLLKNARFDAEKLSFCSFLGLAYYLEKDVFKSLLRQTAEVIPGGSGIVFDYHDKTAQNSLFGSHMRLAAAADEPMNGGCSYAEIEKMLEDCGFLIYEHLSPQEITARFFSAYNAQNPPVKITAPDGVCFCLAVKRR